mmetsp:Transcript_6822/g.9957  ORF Transcript_6822/g.9957 Transcript_6822/m.9957 type:complete len:353 (-) Transcript_6822:66-1124(-)|eukprot:CAMPEP_0194225730 /NCGR_PEP_ID=MMETSP0156-20130528/40223_1 /TAXON_ID=33649 /ORGANISM="Thalassionema nitzschioides, Strain L26-B" /LENGTH=352 /DNA_ID=CAMNT_0038957795 /DNA_START=120 /DNA_END=1178 /DNA_ORIENTATION=-
MNDIPPAPELPKEKSPLRTFYKQVLSINRGNNCINGEEKENTQSQKVTLFLEQRLEQEQQQKEMNNKKEKKVPRSLSLHMSSQPKLSNTSTRHIQSMRPDNKKHEVKVDPATFHRIDPIKMYLKEEESLRNSFYKTCTFVKDLESITSAATTISTLSSTEECSTGEESSTTTKVRFNHVTIHEHSIILGDNVGRSGPPVTIEWEAFNSTPNIPLDQYEQCRKGRRREKQAEMHMPPQMRETILRTYGYSRRELLEGRKAANQARNRRRQTLRSLHLMPLHERIENAKRGLHNAATLGHAKRSERKFLETHVPNYTNRKSSSSQKTTSQQPIELERSEGTTATSSSNVSTGNI